jgi:hypothetical protein
MQRKGIKDMKSKGTESQEFEWENIKTLVATSDLSSFLSILAATSALFPFLSSSSSEFCISGKSCFIFLSLRLPTRFICGEINEVTSIIHYIVESYNFLCTQHLSIVGLLQLPFYACIQM